MYLPLECQSTSKLLVITEITGFLSLGVFHEMHHTMYTDVTGPSSHCPGGHRIQGTNTNPSIVTTANKQQAFASDLGSSYLFPTSVAGYIIVSAHSPFLANVWKTRFENLIYRLGRWLSG